MCKINRTADSASKVIPPSKSTLFKSKKDISTIKAEHTKEQKLRTMPQRRVGEQKLSTMPQMADTEQRQMSEHTQVEPKSGKDEEVILQDRASYSKSRGGPWKVGSLCLTNKRLVFYQHSKLVFQTAVKDVLDVGVRQGRFVLGIKKPLLFLFYKSPVDTALISEREKTFHALFAINEPALWEDEIRKAVVFVRMKKE